MLERTACYGTRLLAGDEKCICFSLKPIMAQVMMVLLSARRQPRYLGELSAWVRQGPGKQHSFCPLLKALLAAVSGAKVFCAWKPLRGRDFAVY